MNKKKLSLIGLVLLVVAIVALWTPSHCAPFSRCPWERKVSGKPKKVSLTIVGSWDSGKEWTQTIANFRQYEIKNRNLDVTVRYTQLDKYNYEEILLDRMVNKKTPNMFMMFNTWLPKYEQRIVPMPASMMSTAQFEKSFPKVTEDDLIADGKIYSLPLYVDTLALYYNKNMFYNAGFIKPPETWNEFADYVEKLTQLDKDGKIKTMGAAIGGSDKVNRSEDILTLMVMQNNAGVYGNKNLTAFKTPEALRAAKFYTDFADPTKRFYTWDYDNQMYSIDAFTQLKAAMSIGYSYDIGNMQNKTGGTLDYGVAAIPQQYADNKINYANYWAPVVAKDAACDKESGAQADCAQLSWDFVKFAATDLDSVRSYVDAAQRPAANLVVAKEQSEKLETPLAPFASQVLTARSWQDVNDSKNDQILVDMIDSIITTDKTKKKDVPTAMGNAANIIKELN
jgi:ABC-type glycerol-3-phosphate transport system substrate-binding protein